MSSLIPPLVIAFLSLSDLCESRVCQTPGCEAGAKLLLSNVNLTADPCDDFAAFACGNWAQSHSAGSGSGSVTESATAEVVNITTEELLKLKNSHFSSDSPFSKANIYFHQCQDYTAKGQLPLSEAAHYILKFAKWPLFDDHWDAEAFDLAQVIGRLQREFGFGTLLDTSVAIDYKHSDQNALYVQQAFLEQPSAKFDAENYQGFLNDYKRAIMLSFKHLFPSDYANRSAVQLKILERVAQLILEFETDMANNIVADRDQLNPIDLYNPISYNQLITEYRSNLFNWTKFFETSLNENLFHRIRNNQSRLILTNPRYTAYMISFITSAKKKTIANYLLWRLVIHMAPYLGENFTEAAGFLHDQKLSLMTPAELVPDLTHCTQQLIQYFEPVTNRLFIQRVWTNELNESATELANQVKTAIADMLKADSWLSSTTLSKALEKLKEMRVEIGYSKWIFDDNRFNDYFKELKLSETNSYFMNFLTVSRWFVNRYYNTLTELPKRGEFQIPTTTVNAQYLPWSNVIQIPAAELLAPNFDASFPAAINYGLTGFTVGHEMFHAFDDTGILFDHRGTLVPDWLFDKESLKIYRAKTRCLVSKYANVCFPEIDSLCINGTATFGENLADTEGVDAAYKAFINHLKLHKTSESERLPGLENLSPQQLFFLSYAVGWCGEVSSEHLKGQLITDSHSPEITRINTVLSNSKEFSDVFQCKPGQTMYSSNHCDIW